MNHDSSAGLLALGGAMFLLFLLFAVVIYVVIAAVMLWKVFVKAGQPGWASLIPIYNNYCLVIIAGKPWWWFLLLFIPVVGFVVYIIVALGIAENFGKSGLFAVGLILLPIIFFPILGFGDATYGPARPPAGGSPAAA